MGCNFFWQRQPATKTQLTGCTVETLLKQTEGSIKRCWGCCLLFEHMYFYTIFNWCLCFKQPVQRDSLTIPDSLSLVQWHLWTKAEGSWGCKAKDKSVIPTLNLYTESPVRLLCTRRMMFKQQSIKLTHGKEWRIVYGSIRLTRLLKTKRRHKGNWKYWSQDDRCGLLLSFYFSLPPPLFLLSCSDVIPVYQHVHSHEAVLTAQPQITTAVNNKTQI